MSAPKALHFASFSVENLKPPAVFEIHYNIGWLGGHWKKNHPLTAEEWGPDFDIQRVLKYGQLSALIGVESPRELLDTYVGMYLKEEVQQEALARRLDQLMWLLCLK